jgi:hypothetical protein
MSNNDGSRYNTGPDDIAARMQNLENRIAILERVPSLSNASIDSSGLTVKEGAIRVVDADGNIRIKMGKLDDGNYDITAYSADGTATVNLAALAFGPVGAFDTNTCTSTVNFGAYADPVTGSAGPSVTVTIGSSGRCKVTISAYLDYIVAPPPLTNGGQLNMSYFASGANTIGAPGDDRAVGDYLTGTSSTVAFHRVIRVGRTNYHSGLNPGITTFKCVYAADVDSGSSLTHGFADRSIIVEPF